MNPPPGAWNPLGALQAAATASIWAGVVLVALAAALLALWLQVRDRRRWRGLIERLDRLEQSAASVGAGRSEVDAPAIGSELEAEASADVLHGRTTWVRRLVRSPAEPLLPLADQAIVQVFAALDRNLSPAELAQALCVSLRTLERGLAQTLACSPRQLILAVKMREARRLLQRGARVSEVAARLGFASAFHFSRRFKGFYHVAPSEVRTGAAPGPPAREG